MTQSQVLDLGCGRRRQVVRTHAPRSVQSLAHLYRLWVMFNGGAFHLTGRLLEFRGRSESFQTKRAAIRALEEAGFAVLSLGRRIRSFEAIEVAALKRRTESLAA